MRGYSEFRAKVKAGKGPYAVLRRVAKFILSPTAPRVPSFAKPFFRMLYGLRWMVVVAGRLLLTFFVRQPLFQSRCKVVGRNLVLTGPMPFVTGPVEIELGEDVVFGGKVCILSGGPVAKPRLVMKDRSGIGWGSVISIGMEVIIEEDVIISYDCRISDTDGHRREADLRAEHVPPRTEDIRPVRICRHAWIGNGTHIMKGVTIGEGAVIGANSVVITDIPPYALALGNPAEVYFRNYGKQTKVAARNQATV
jgi:carbonic anhydrase/acetyltransferase-like protein (isoleucine patch superfamily)